LLGTANGPGRGTDNSRPPFRRIIGLALVVIMPWPATASNRDRPESVASPEKGQIMTLEGKRTSGSFLATADPHGWPAETFVNKGFR